MRASVVSRCLRLAVALAAFLMLQPPSPTQALRVRATVEPWPELTERIPLRSPVAPSGSEFVRAVAGFELGQRRQAIHDQFLAGNIPDFLRRLRPVQLDWEDRRGVTHRATVFVTPDYLAIGADDDFVRIPMGLYSAVSVARDFGFVLPTRKMVDAIYDQADVKVTPRPMKPGATMTSVDYLWRHNQMIDAQLAGRPRGLLVAGDKKDLVLTNRLLRKARKVAIYGWHQADGSPIQPLSTIHDGRYADYSHGVRLVSATAVVDGRPRSVFDVLEDPRLARLLSYEGVMRAARQVMSLPFSPAAAPPTDLADQE